MLSQHLPTWLVSWIAAYFSGRRQRVLYNRMPTAWKDVIAGVIQGSVLGPILFLLFSLSINDYVPPGVCLLKYADDILIYCTGIFDPSLLQQATDGVQAWCVRYKMRLNIKKCKVLSSGYRNCHPTILIDGIALEPVDTYKYLGIDLNITLDPSQQWNRVYSQVCSLIPLLRKLQRVGWDTEMLLSAYRAYGLSHLTYSAVVLMSCTAVEKAEMTSFQNRALRVIGISQDLATSSHNISPITDLIDDICQRIFNRIIADPTHPVTASLTVNERSKKYVVPSARTTTYINSFLVTHLRMLCNDGRSDLYTNSNASLP